MPLPDSGEMNIFNCNMEDSEGGGAVKWTLGEWPPGSGEAEVRIDAEGEQLV